MTWKSTSSNGWEYLVVWDDLGLSPMYACYVLFICYILNGISDNVILRLEELS